MPSSPRNKKALELRYVEQGRIFVKVILTFLYNYYITAFKNYKTIIIIKIYL